jgi:TetR/AcrR family transcriptional regulator, regulator of biofilm formation and stress response
VLTAIATPHFLKIVSTLIEGLFIHISLDPPPRSRSVTRDAVRRILSL